MWSGVARTSAVIGMLAAAVGLSAADAAAQPSLRGPASAIPGRKVTFHARGLRAGSTVNVMLSPADRSTCCAIGIEDTFFVSSSGRAALTFHVPLYYHDCRMRPHCRKAYWTTGERVTVTVFGYLENAATETVIRRPPRKRQSR